MTRSYRIHGLCVRSSLAFPELSAAAVDGEPADVDITVGDVAPSLSGGQVVSKHLEVAERRALIRTACLGRILVEDGQHIRIHPTVDAHEDDVRHLLLGWGCGVLLWQRGRLVLHASAVADHDAALAVCGPSGTGKTTLAGAMLRHGYGLLDDNLVPVDDGRVHPGAPVLRLCKDAASRLGYEVDVMRTILTNGIKFAVPLPRQEERAKPLTAIYVFRQADTPRAAALDERSLPADVVRLRGSEAVKALFGQIFLPHVVKASVTSADLFKRVFAVAARVPVFQVDVPVARPGEWVLAQALADHHCAVPVAGRRPSGPG